MALKITELTLSDFRTFERLDLKGLGRVNLITGRNNTGKSSVLEALRIISSKGNLRVIYNILSDREEDFRENPQVEEEDTKNVFRPLTSIFRDFPENLEDVKPIKISIKGRKRKFDLVLRLDRAREEKGKWKFASEEPESSAKSRSDGDLEARWPYFAFVREIDGKKFPMPLDDSAYRFRRRRYFDPEWDSGFGSKAGRDLSYRYVAPGGHGTTAPLASLWDEIALTDKERHVVEALKVIDPNIDGVSMVSGRGTGRSRTAVVRVGNLNHPVPLRSFGDGLHRLFGMTLSLVNAKDGLLLIDEFENGLHHTVQDDVWRIVFRLAEELDVQVFATSHSWDAVEAFQRAATRTEEAGKLVRLTSVKDAIEPTIFGEEELKVMTRERIEVR